MGLSHDLPRGLVIIEEFPKPLHKPELNLDDGGLAAIHAFEADPMKVLDQAETLWTYWVRCDVHVHMKKIGCLSTFYEEVIDDFKGFRLSVDLLVLWCDAVQKTIDPLPLLQSFRHYSRAVYFEAREWQRKQRSGEGVIERLPMTDAERIIQQNGRVLYGGAHLTDSCCVLDRVRIAANLEYHRQLSARPPIDDDLVTMLDVSEIVHLEKRTLERYRPDWPKPDVTVGGNQPDKWIYARLRPTLVEQFPDLDLPYTPSRKGNSASKNGNGDSLTT